MNKIIFATVLAITTPLAHMTKNGFACFTLVNWNHRQRLKKKKKKKKIVQNAANIHVIK